jgi:hypothetical protein
MNLVIITSLINCTNNPLSYSKTRTIFDKDQRFIQTLKSIDCIKNKIKNCEILFCECSNICNSEYEKIIRAQVNY